MIAPVLPPACYTDEKWFALEKQKLFGELWLFAGLTQQLSQENSFITREFNGISVLVQNLGGELKAFRNACAHRGMPLQTADFGTRKLVCPYHGWAYKDDGCLRGIPNEKIYNLSAVEKQAIQLQSFALKTLGNFVFVNLSPAPRPIAEQFSNDLIRILVEVSPYFAPDVSFTHFECAYNWKLNYENILDWNHFHFVHKQTLAPLLDIRQDGTIRSADTESSRLFAAHAPLADIQWSNQPSLEESVQLHELSSISRSAMPYAARWFSELFESPCDRGAFFNCKIFPNLNFGSIHGETFYLQQYVPTAPNRIEYHSWIFTTRLKPNVAPQPHLLWGIHHAEKRVIDEDVVLLTALQKALTTASSVGVMGDHEASLAAVGQWYLEQLGNADDQR